jgi:hypothetical protein
MRPPSCSCPPARSTSTYATCSPSSGSRRGPSWQRSTWADRYRAALDAGADPAVVTNWIAQTQAERRAAQAALDATNPTPAAQRALAAQVQLTEQTLRALIDKLGNVADALATADPDRKADAYRALGLNLTYQPQTRSVHIKIDLDVDRSGLWLVGEIEAEGAVGVGLAVGVGGGQSVGDVAELVDQGPEGLFGELDLGGQGALGGGGGVGGVEGGLGGAAFGLGLGDPVGDDGGVGSGVQGCPVAISPGRALPARPATRSRAW